VVCVCCVCCVVYVCVVVVVVVYVCAWCVCDGGDGGEYDHIQVRVPRVFEVPKPALNIGQMKSLLHLKKAGLDHG